MEESKELEVLCIKQSDSVLSGQLEDKMDDDIQNIQDITRKHVLRFVPAKSLYRFKSVSKRWNKWISSPFLAHQQATHFTKTSGFFSLDSNSFIPLSHRSHGVPSPSLSFLPESTSIRTTSNGLLCCQSTSQDNIYFICNPATQEWKQLPLPTLFHGTASALALAYTPSTYNFHSHFQLVCAVPVPLPSDSLKAVYFEIYSSWTNSWRVVESTYIVDIDVFKQHGVSSQDQLTMGEGVHPSYIGCEIYSKDIDVDSDWFRGDGFCINEVVYWEASNGVVLMFDLHNELHGEMEIRLPADHLIGLGVLTEMCGELCYVVVMTCNGAYSLGVYGGHDMAVLKRRIPLEVGDFNGEVRVLSSISDGVVVILVGRRVFLYDVEERVGKFVRKVGPAERVVVGRFLPYVNSLVRVCPVEMMPSEDRYFDEILLKKKPRLEDMNV